jgi:hypothetical protein
MGVTGERPLITTLAVASVAAFGCGGGARQKNGSRLGRELIRRARAEIFDAEASGEAVAG